MHGNHVVESQGEVGKIFRENLLYFAAQRFSFFLIYFHANLIGERVHARVAVVSAVGSIRRESLGKTKTEGKDLTQRAQR